MDNQIGLNQLKEVKNFCLESLKKDSDGICFPMEEDKSPVEVLQSSQTVKSYQRDTSLPVTPDSDRESIDLRFDLSSLLASVSPPSQPHCLLSQKTDNFCFPEDDCISPHTPKGGVFDPFASCSDKLMPSPSSKNVLEHTQITRRLEFDPFITTAQDDNCNYQDDPVPVSVDHMILETMYHTFLELVYSNQMKELHCQVSPQDVDSDGFKSPTSPPLINGIADTCPGAPMKSTGKLRYIKPELCRKLEF